MGLIEEAQARVDARPAPRQIDYALMNRLHPKQKAALTRAVNAYKHVIEGLDYYDRSHNPAVAKAAEAIAQVCKKAVDEWHTVGAWPDDWARWQNALDDALGWNSNIRLEDL